MWTKFILTQVEHDYGKKKTRATIEEARFGLKNSRNDEALNPKSPSEFHYCGAIFYVV